MATAGKTKRSSTNGNGGATKAETAAHKAREKVDARREKASGLEGAVADRAGQWSLDDRDPAWLERQKWVGNPLMDLWFRMEIEGWEKLPPPPALLIGVHSGAPFVWDAWTVGFQWWRQFGEERVLHGTAHDALMAAPGVGDVFRKMGVLPAASDSISTALAAGRDVALWPGGEVDSLRPWTDRDKAVLAGRKGFVRMAISTGVPIVPIATVGGPDSMPVLARGTAAGQGAAVGPDRAAEDVPDLHQRAVGHLSRNAAGGAAAHQDPHGVPGADRGGQRSRAGRRRGLRGAQVRRGAQEHPGGHGPAGAAAYGSRFSADS